MATRGHLGRWTRYFAVGSACWLVVVALLQFAGAGRVPTATAAVFGFVCPMVFGMAYLLVPSYAGTTLVDQRLPGVHLACAFGAAALLSGWLVAGLGRWALVAGAVLWAAGVVAFGGSLAWTVLPAVAERPELVVRSEARPQRSTRLGTALVPVAVGYLPLGTTALLGRAGLVPRVVPASLPSVVHFHAAGFAALLVFALGVRLLTGFFHVSPPDRLARVVLSAGAAGPLLLATHMPAGPWFRVGAALEATALVGYAVLVVSVARRTAWERVGLYGIVLGALAGAAAAAVALSVAFGDPVAARLAAHAALILGGFFPLTVAGYAVQFFAVPAGRFPGGSDATVLLAFAGLAGGTVVRTGGFLLGTPAASRFGSLVFLAGAVTYAYLLTNRLLLG